MDPLEKKPPIKTHRPKLKLVDMAEMYEEKGHHLLLRLTVRLVTGFLHFRRRKGEILAGSTTFFGILSFGPVLLLMISLVGWSGLNTLEAKDYVLNVVKMNFPELAPSLLKSVEEVITAQLDKKTSLTHLFFLFYSTLGIVASIMYGMHAIAKQEIRGGFLFEDLRSLMVGIFGGLFIATLLFYGHYAPVMAKNIQSDGFFYDASRYFLQGQIIPIFFSLGFFTFFYQFASTNHVRLRDSFLGAITFVACFSVGKSFYWLYLQLSKDTLTSNYGNFYTLFVAVFWVYFLMCSFFYGASVAYAGQEKVDQVVPPIPKPELNSNYRQKGR